MSNEKGGLCNNPFAALLGSVSQEDATKSGMYLYYFSTFIIF